MDIAIIKNQEILFCSDKFYNDIHPIFEIPIFIQVLLEQINHNQNWNIRKILMHNLVTKSPSKLIIWHSEYNENLEEKFNNSKSYEKFMICAYTERNIDDNKIFNLLKKLSTEFYLYSNNTTDKTNEHCQYLKQTFNDFISNEGIFQKELIKKSKPTGFWFDDNESINLNNKNNNIEFLFEENLDTDRYIGHNKVIYLGISHNGLPLNSKIFPKQDLFYEENDEKREIITSTLSGQLATILINAQIRANQQIEQVELKITTENGAFSKKSIYLNFFPFGFENHYTLELLTVGEMAHAIQIRKEMAQKLLTADQFRNPFDGTLKNFKFLEGLVNRYL